MTHQFTELDRKAFRMAQEEFENVPSNERRSFQRYLEKAYGELGNSKEFYSGDFDGL